MWTREGVRDSHESSRGVCQQCVFAGGGQPLIRRAQEVRCGGGLYHSIPVNAHRIGLAAFACQWLRMTLNHSPENLPGPHDAWQHYDDGSPIMQVIPGG